MFFPIWNSCITTGLFLKEKDVKSCNVCWNIDESKIISQKVKSLNQIWRNVMHACHLGADNCKWPVVVCYVKSIHRMHDRCTQWAWIYSEGVFSFLCFCIFMVHITFATINWDKNIFWSDFYLKSSCVWLPKIQFSRSTFSFWMPNWW